MTNEQFNLFISVLERIANAQEEIRDELQYLNNNQEKLLKRDNKVLTKES